MYIRPHTHTADINCIIKIIKTISYQQKLHNNFNLVTFTVSLIM
jgi:hypothetical protein